MYRIIGRISQILPPTGLGDDTYFCFRVVDEQGRGFSVRYDDDSSYAPTSVFDGFVPGMNIAATVKEPVTSNEKTYNGLGISLLTD